MIFRPGSNQGSLGSELRPPLRLGLGPTGLGPTPEFDGLYSHQPKRSAPVFFWFGSNQTRQVWIRCYVYIYKLILGKLLLRRGQNSGGKMAFKVFAPSSWNNLQKQLKLQDLVTLSEFKAVLKLQMF